MPELFDATLREGTEQVVAALAPPSAPELRALGERRARSRRTGSLALCAVALLAIGGTTAGVYGLRAPENGPAAAASATPDAGPSHPATGSPSATPSAEATGPVQVRIAGPSVYAAETANKVQVTFTNPDPERQVIVEFDTTGTGIFEWTEGCDAGSDNGCTETSLAGNGLQLTQGALGKTTSQAVRFSLDLPHGTSTYDAWVNPPRNASTFTVRVLDDKAARVFGSAQSARVTTEFVSQTLASLASKSISRGGGYVDFSATVSNPTGGGYIHLDQLGTVACSANGSPVSVSSSDYSLEWYTGDGWTTLKNGAAWQAMSYDLQAGQATTVKFRLDLSGSLSSQATNCVVTLTVSNVTFTNAPYYDKSQPYSQALEPFTVN